MALLTYDQRLSKLEKALTRVERMRMYEPFWRDNFTNKEIAWKFQCTPYQIRNLIVNERLNASVTEILNNPLTSFTYRVTRYFLKKFLKENLSNGAVTPEDVLNSRILKSDELLKIFDFCRMTFDVSLANNLTYFDIGCCSFSVKRFVGGALELNILDMISETLGLGEKVHSTRILARRWNRKSETVLFYVERDDLDALDIGFNNLPHYIYLDSEVRRFEEEGHLGRIGRPRKENKDDPFLILEDSRVA